MNRNLIQNINSDLKIIDEAIKRSEYKAYRGISATEGWGGADVVFSTVPIDTTSQEFYPAPRNVVTKHAHAAGWLLNQLRDVFYKYELVDSVTKIEFFGRLAHAANNYIRSVGDRVSSPRGLLRILLQEAKEILWEIRSGNFSRAGVAADDATTLDISNKTEEEKVSLLTKNVMSICDYLRGASDTYEMFIAIFLLCIYKRLSDINNSNDTLPSIKNIGTCNWYVITIPDHKNDIPEKYILSQIQEQLISLELGNDNIKGVFSGMLATLKYGVLAIEEEEIVFRMFSRFDFTRSVLSESTFDSLLLSIMSSFKSLTISEYDKPYDLCDMIVSLIKPAQNEKIYVPFTGTGNPLIAVFKQISGARSLSLKSLNVDAVEINSLAWAIAKIRIALLGITESSLKRIPDNDVLDLADEVLEKQLDVIVTMPPFAIKTYGNVPLMIPIGKEEFKVPRSKGELWHMIVCLRQLSDKGRMAIVLPSSFLTDSFSNKLRRYLVDNDLIEYVINIAPKTFKHTQIGAVGIIINKGKQESAKGHVRFVDYNAAMSPYNGAMLNIVDMKDEIDYSYDNEGTADLISIQKNNYLLASSMYIGKLKHDIDEIYSNHNGVMLSDICKSIKRGAYFKSDVAVGKKKPTIFIKNLSKGVTDPSVDVDNIEYNYSRSEADVIQNKVILVALQGGNPKVTIFDPDQISLMDGFGNAVAFDGIYVSHSIAILTPDEDKVDIEYLYYQLNEDIFKRQYEALTSQSGPAPSLTAADLANIVVPLFPTSEQKKYTEQLKVSLLEAENARIEALRERLKIPSIKQEAQFDLIHHLAHDINPKLNGVAKPLRLLKRFLADKNLLSELVAPEHDSERTVDKLISNAESSIKFIADLLNNAQRFVEKKIDPNSFTEEYLLEFFRSEIASFSNKIRNIKIEVNGSEEITCKISKHFFKTVIENLLENATRHSATEVIFNISEDSRNVFIDYMNNGEPFPVDFTKKEFLTYGKKSQGSPGSGQGGAWIGKIIDAHNGEFNIIPDDFPVHFRIQLPKRGNI